MHGYRDPACDVKMGVVSILHGMARYSEALEGARQQTSTALVFYGRLHFPSVATLKRELFIRQLLAAIWRLTNQNLPRSCHAKRCYFTFSI